VHLAEAVLFPIVYIFYVAAVLLISFLRVNCFIILYIETVVVNLIIELVEETKREKTNASRGSILQQVSRCTNNKA
jgi:hypothetical protein